MRHFPDVCCLIYNPAWLVLPLCCLSCTTNPARLVLSLIYKTCMACSSLCHLLYTNPTSACASCQLSSYTNLAQLVLPSSFTNPTRLVLPSAAFHVLQILPGLCFLSSIKPAWLVLPLCHLSCTNPTRLVLPSAIFHIQIPPALVLHADCIYKPCTTCSSPMPGLIYKSVLLADGRHLQTPRACSCLCHAPFTNPTCLVLHVPTHIYNSRRACASHQPPSFTKMVPFVAALPTLSAVIYKNRWAHPSHRMFCLRFILTMSRFSRK